jgi:hypothetical protein
VLYERQKRLEWRKELSEFLGKVKALVRKGDVRISEHGYDDELADDGPTEREVLGGLQKAVVIEEYPEYLKGPCVLLLDEAATRRKKILNSCISLRVTKFRAPLNQREVYYGSA